MTSSSSLTALAIARALLAGPHTGAGMAARVQACVGSTAAWTDAVAARCAALPPAQWRRLVPRTLATFITREADYRQACRAAGAPRVQRHILRPPSGMRPPPLGLHDCQLPNWPDLPALHQWLGVSDGGVWRLTRPADWQRGTPLVDQHYRCQLLPKRSGGWRLLEVPEPYLMALQRRLASSLLNAVPPHEAACGYARGRSVVDHARAHAGQAVLLTFDLQDFFTAVPASRVHALLTTLGYSDPVASTLTALCTTATPEPVLRRLHADGGLTWPQLQRLRDAHLPQGASTSPALANLCAFRLDLRLQGLAHALGARYTRYADDIVLSGGAHLQQAFTRIAAWVGHIVRDEGFALNHRKTRCLATGRRQAVCNIVVNGGSNLPRDDFDRLKALLHQCVRDGPSAHNRGGHPHWRLHLQGRVAWAAQLNPVKAQRLRRWLAQIDWTR